MSDKPPAIPVLVKAKRIPRRPRTPSNAAFQSFSAWFLLPQKFRAIQWGCTVITGIFMSIAFMVLATIFVPAGMAMVSPAGDFTASGAGQASFHDVISLMIQKPRPLDMDRAKG